MTASAAAQPVETLVHVTGLRSTQGRVLVAAHAERASFPSQWERASAMQSVPAATASSATITIALKLPAAGRYALIVVHDEDGDGRMTKNIIGLPREGYTTGNNPSGLEFPRFDRALIEVREPRRIDVQIHYP